MDITHRTVEEHPASGPGAKAWAAIAALGVVWGATFMGITLALEGFPPLWVATGRLVLATAVLAALVPFVPNRVEPDGRRRWPYLLTIGLLGAAAPYALLSWGQQHVSSGFAGVSMAAIALLILPLSHAFVPGERMTWAKSLGVAVGFAGVVTLYATRLGESSDVGLLGPAAVLGATACYAVSSIATRLVPPFEPVRLATWQLATGAAIALPATLALEGLPPLPEWRPTLALLALALVPTALANLLRVYVIRTAGPQFMSLTNYQVPIWAVVFGAAFLGEPVPSTLLIALALILGGIAITQRAPIQALVGRWLNRSTAAT